MRLNDADSIYLDGDVDAVYLGSTLVWQAIPVVQITGTSGTQSRDQFRAACIQYGTTYQTVTELPFLLDTSAATNMSNMFFGCTSLASVPDMDTSNVTNTNSMFYNCSSLTSVPDMDTSSVTDMSAMFLGCSALTSVPDMDTSSVTNMSAMFQSCSALVAAPSMDTSNVTNTSSMFYNCPTLVAAPSMDTSSVTTMAYMFFGCTNLEYVPELRVDALTAATFMFSNCYSLRDGNVKLIRDNYSILSFINTSGMLDNNQLTRMPFWHTNGDPIPAEERYVSSSGSREIPRSDSMTTVGSFTVSGAGFVDFTLNFHFRGSPLQWASRTRNIYIYRNSLREAHVSRDDTVGYWESTLNANNILVRHGDEVSVRALIPIGNSDFRTLNWWNITMTPR